MTALVGREVKRTFSGVLNLRTRLSRQSTLKANSEQFGDLRNDSRAAVRGIAHPQPPPRRLCSSCFSTSTSGYTIRLPNLRKAGPLPHAAISAESAARSTNVSQGLFRRDVGSLPELRIAQIARRNRGRTQRFCRRQPGGIRAGVEMLGLRGVRVRRRARSGYSLVFLLGGVIHAEAIHALAV